MLTFKEFEEHMGRLKALFEKDDKINNFIQEMTFDGYGFFYNDAITQIIDLLKILMEDTSEKDSWIEYYVYELDFGKRWEKGMVTQGAHSSEIKDKVYPLHDYKLEPGEEDIPLKTVEDLYNLLVDNAEGSNNG